MQSGTTVKAKFINYIRRRHKIWCLFMALEPFLLNLSLELGCALRNLPSFSNSHSRYFMSALFISLLTLVLILISAFVILLVLMQRTSQSGGMGAALGGGAAESAFGSNTTNILTKGTIYGIIAFFLVALGLFLMYQSEASNRTQVVSAGELISSEEVALVAETVEAVVEDVVAVVEDAGGTIEAVVESVEVVAPVADVEASTTETVPTSN
ncbi:MAG: hypothetical protein ABS34_03395 [Opitutaceae bacterium BACL24 MAG-120322-bin51]|jgi:preprotein translocase subunit SecG|nr:MAG: hypothetical protein ABS34_03395 [Opitutaceae bacterium BACL24 MAG-120322-bin51]